MIITDLRKITYTEPEDYKTFIALLKKFRWRMAWLMTTENGQKFYNIGTQRGKMGLLRYSNKAFRKKPEFTLEVVDYSYINAFLKEKRGMNTNTHFNFPQLFKTELPYRLFEEIFGITKENITLDNLNGEGKREWIMVSNDCYLIINSKFIYATKIINGESVQQAIPDWVEAEFKIFKYLCVSKPRKYGK